MTTPPPTRSSKRAEVRFALAMTGLYLGASAVVIGLVFCENPVSEWMKRVTGRRPSWLFIDMPWWDVAVVSLLLGTVGVLAVAIVQTIARRSKT